MIERQRELAERLAAPSGVGSRAQGALHRIPLPIPLAHAAAPPRSEGQPAALTLQRMSLQVGRPSLVPWRQ